MPLSFCRISRNANFEPKVAKRTMTGWVNENFGTSLYR